ncbi:MAG: hypothetical protein ACW97V_15670 [Promethearchaeota archaeon]
MFAINKSDSRRYYFKKKWKNITKILLEPSKTQLKITRKDNRVMAVINKEDVDLADVVIRVIEKK